MILTMLVLKDIKVTFLPFLNDRKNIRSDKGISRHMYWNVDKGPLKDKQSLKKTERNTIKQVLD